MSDWSSDVCSSDLHPVDLAGADFLFETEAVAMGDLARIKIGHGRKAVMRVGAHIEIARDAGRQFQWPQMIEKDERLDHPARVDGQIGSASCRESVCQSVYISVVDVTVKNKYK